MKPEIIVIVDGVIQCITDADGNDIWEESGRAAVIDFDNLESGCCPVCYEQPLADIDVPCPKCGFTNSSDVEIDNYIAARATLLKLRAAFE